MNHELSSVQNESCTAIEELSKVTSIPEAMWMTIATLATVGLGDVVPTSPFGQMFNSIVMYMGITVLALPMTVISSKFEGNYRRFKHA
jgi:voltage-gated potassium channel Kch